LVIPSTPHNPIVLFVLLGFHGLFLVLTHCGMLSGLYAWSDGRTQYRTEPMSGLTFKAMQQTALYTTPEVPAA